jgi:predicted outer membrane repeat protein
MATPFNDPEASFKCILSAKPSTSEPVANIAIALQICNAIIGNSDRNHPNLTGARAGGSCTSIFTSPDVFTPPIGEPADTAICFTMLHTIMGNLSPAAAASASVNADVLTDASNAYTAMHPCDANREFSSSLKPSRKSGILHAFSPKILFAIFAFAAMLPVANAACHDTLPPAPTIINVTNHGEGILKVDFEDEHAFQLAMVIDPESTDLWQYYSTHWTSSDLLDDGKNMKTKFFNERYNKIRVEMYILEGGGYSDVPFIMEWTHNLGLSLQEIFSSDQFIPADNDIGEWIGLMGRDPAHVSEYEIPSTKGFNAEFHTAPRGTIDVDSDVIINGGFVSHQTGVGTEPNGNIAMRLGVGFSSSNPLDSASSLSSVIGIGFNPVLAEYKTIYSVTGGRCNVDISSKMLSEGPQATGAPCHFSWNHRRGQSPAKTKIYVGNQDAGCRNYTVSTNPTFTSTVTTTSPAMITGLDPTSSGLLVSVESRSAVGSGPAALSTTPVRPCHCACEAFAAPEIISVSSTLSDGVLRVNFTQPRNVPADCAGLGMINYTITTDPPPPPLKIPEREWVVGGCTVCGEDRIVIPLKPSECPVGCGNTTGHTVDGVYNDGWAKCNSCSITCGDLCEGDGISCGSGNHADNCGGVKDIYRVMCTSQTWMPPFATIEGLDPAVSYTTKIVASNDFGSSPPTISRSVTPCFCSCDVPNAPTIYSSTSHLKGTVSIRFNGPTNVPSSCHDDRGIVWESIGNHRVHSDGHVGIDYTVTAVPVVGNGRAVTATFSTTTATIIGLDPSTEYNVHVRASNALGSSSASAVVPTRPMPNGHNSARSWPSIREFMSGLTANTPMNATFTLLSPHQDPSAGYNGQIPIHGRSHLVIYGAGVILDANGTGGFFHLNHERGASLTVYNLTMRNGNAGPLDAGCGGGAITASHASLALYDCTFESCTALSSGGGAFDANALLTLIIVGCLFSGNSAKEGGGALFVERGKSVTIRDSEFVENDSGHVGGALGVTSVLDFVSPVVIYI